MYPSAGGFGGGGFSHPGQQPQGEGMYQCKITDFKNICLLIT